MDLDSNFLERVFLVGCPRSGTTLIQSFLTAHPTIESFPESHFFRYLFKDRGKKRRTLNLGSRFIRGRLEEFLTEIGHSEKTDLLSRYNIFVPQYIHSFVNFLDREALSKDKKCWIEKTPGHIQYVNIIEKYIPDAVFIHVIRDGLDVVASLYEVTRKYPEAWHGPWTIEKCIQRWIECVEASLEKIDNPKHLVLSYESFIKDPKNSLLEMGEFLDISLEYEELQDLRMMESHIITKTESWKSASIQPIHNKNSNHSKFKEIFSDKEKNYISNAIKDFGITHPEIKKLR